MGVWIETRTSIFIGGDDKVTPFVGVWIETLNEKEYRQKRQSHPSWVCGLKPNRVIKKYNRRSHTLRGCVD